MAEESSKYLPDPGRDHLKQQAIARYKFLKSIKKTELSLEDKLFLENFQCAMSFLWNFPEHNKEHISGSRFWLQDDPKGYRKNNE